MGPHPFPTIVRDFQAVISREARQQILEAQGKLPDAVVACVGGGSNAMGMFYHFIGDEGVKLIGCEAAGRGIETGEHAATIADGSLGVFHGMKSLFCQNEYGQIKEVSHCFARMSMGRSKKSTRSRRASTIPGSALSTLGCTISAARSMCRSQTTRRWKLSNISRGRRASSARSRARTRWRRPGSSHPR